MTEAVFRLPLTLELKPSRDLRHLLMVAGGATALSLMATPGLSGWLSAGWAAAVMALSILAYRRTRSRRRLTLLPDGYWIPPGEADACALAASSVDLFGVFWLHGRSEDGQRHAVMVMPDALVHPEGWRWLCVWFRNAPRLRPMPSESPGN
ncbi:MAG TPA: hypothetical protein PK620_01025 [Denitromonas sp.]|uniref:protein YgfX n=1 Tax=Denitromonas sp. TaxID=2734609 RepID=UPI001D8978F8|nr:hypothetical protein [Rhodocyclaceae bacterium]MCP5220341.1 hypothetical protein [Zoogloeaceae bacterium]HPR05794.1 hypothetical protein [Denitromonas sp.]HQV13466.1 hypothetical protein [Denitromonas sp.]